MTIKLRLSSSSACSMCAPETLARTQLPTPVIQSVQGSLINVCYAMLTPVTWCAINVPLGCCRLTIASHVILPSLTIRNFLSSTGYRASLLMIQRYTVLIITIQMDNVLLQGLIPLLIEVLIYNVRSILFKKPLMLCKIYKIKTYMNKSMQLSTYFKEIITFSNVMAMKTKLLIQGIQLLFRSIVPAHFSIYCQESFGLMI